MVGERRGREGRVCVGWGGGDLTIPRVIKDRQRGWGGGGGGRRVLFNPNSLICQLLNEFTSVPKFVILYG